VRPRFIKRAQELGFTLKEIAEPLALRHEPDTDTFVGDYRNHGLGYPP
jgi:DNA-binding transcriptional MerR regulator